MIVRSLPHCGQPWLCPYLNMLENMLSDNFYPASHGNIDNHRQYNKHGGNVWDQSTPT